MPRSKPPAAALLASPEDIEAQFYEALQQGDLERLMAVWAEDDEIACVHPGGPRLVGHAAIRASFEAIFGNGGVPAQPERLHRLQTLGSAVHHVNERIDIQTAEGVQTAWVLATNVFVKTSQGWRLAVHHASPGAVGEAVAVAAPPSSTLH